MKRCPGPLTWQAVIDGEEEGSRHAAHLESCPACRALYREIEAAAGLAGRLRCNAAPRPGFAALVLAGARSVPRPPFPAGSVAALLFALAGAAALLLDPGCWDWWLSVGMTRSCSLLLDALFGLLHFGRDLNPACLLGLTVPLVLLEIVLLRNLKTAGGH